MLSICPIPLPDATASISASGSLQHKNGDIVLKTVSPEISNSQSTGLPVPGWRYPVQRYRARSSTLAGNPCAFKYSGEEQTICWIVNNCRAITWAVGAVPARKPTSIRSLTVSVNRSSSSRSNSIPGNLDANSVTRGTNTLRPTAPPALMRISPSSSRAALRVLLMADVNPSRFDLTASKRRWPSSVKELLRVVLWNSLTPKFCSSSRMVLLTAWGVVPCATAVL